MSGGFEVAVLAVGPHPDDVEINCGGILARMAALGHSTGIVDLTRGEMASRGTVQEREREAEEAAAVLGVAFRENLGLPDAGLDATSADQVRRVAGMIRRHRPELLLIPWIEERHPDHVEAAAMLVKAAYLAGLRQYATDPPAERFTPRQVLHYEQRFRMTPSFIVDTSEAWERKLQAMRCHHSQVTPSATAPPTLIGSELALAAIEARDRHRGSMIGVTHGEALRCVATPGLSDPVAHFRQNPFPGAHAFESLR